MVRSAAIVILALAAVGCTSSPAPSVGSVRISGVHTLGAAVEVENLTVWPVFTDRPIDVGEFLTLHEAIDGGVAEIREQGGGGGAQQVAVVEMNDLPVPNDADVSGVQTGQVMEGGASVGTLVIENKGSKPLLVCAGTVVKGGNQDRQIGQDIVIAVGTTVPVDAFCVEQSRWDPLRDGLPTNGQFVAGASNAMKSVRLKGQYENDQGEVWNEVAKVKVQYAIGANDGTSTGGQNARVVAGSTSLAVVLDANDEVQKERLEKLEAAVRKHFAANGKAVGFAYAVNGEPVSVRTFAHSRVFKGQFDPFLKSMCTEAVLQKPEGAAPKAKVEDVVKLVQEIEAADETIAETRAMNLNGVRSGKTGFNGNCYLPGEEGKKRVALTRDWSAK